MVRRRSTAGVALLPWWPAIQLVSDVVKGVEALGATIVVNGACARSTTMPYRWSGYGACKKATVGSGGGRAQAILPGLTVVIAAAIVRTTIVDAAWKAGRTGEDRHYPDRAQLFSSSRDRRDLVPFGLGLWRCSHGGRRFGVGLCSYRRILAFAVWNSSSVIAPEAFNSASLASSSALSWGLDASWT